MEMSVGCVRCDVDWQVTSHVEFINTKFSASMKSIDVYKFKLLFISANLLYNRSRSRRDPSRASPMSTRSVVKPCVCWTSAAPASASTTSRSSSVRQSCSGLGSGAFENAETTSWIGAPDSTAVVKSETRMLSCGEHQTIWVKRPAGSTESGGGTASALMRAVSLRSWTMFELASSTWTRPGFVAPSVKDAYQQRLDKNQSPREKALPLALFLPLLSSPSTVVSGPSDASGPASPCFNVNASRKVLRGCHSGYESPYEYVEVYM